MPNIEWLSCRICTTSTVPGTSISRLFTKNISAIYSNLLLDKSSCFLSSLPTLGVSKLIRFCQSIGVKWNLTRFLLFISLIISQGEHLSQLGTQVSSCVNCLLMFFARVQLSSLSFSYWFVWLLSNSGHLYLITEKSCKYVFLGYGLSFHLFFFSAFCYLEDFHVNIFQMSIICFRACDFYVLRNYSLSQCHENMYCVFSYEGFRVLLSTLRTITHLEFIILYGVRGVFNFNFYIESQQL